MKAYLAHIKLNLKLTLRDRLVLFFNYIFPLLFFLIFGQMMGTARGGLATQLVTMVLIIGVLGSGFFGAGIRAVQDRELNILRRFKVAPVGPAPMLVASMVTGWANYMPMALLILVCARYLYGMPMPRNWVSLLVFLSLGILAFRAVGLMIASVVNSAQEGQILIQIFYFPMLFLSGATFPLEVMPEWVQTLAQFLPASHLFLGIQGILVRNETIFDVWTAALALAAACIVATFLSTKLFRWEKGERIRGASKAWLAAALLPFVLLGTWQAYSRENLGKVKMISREMRRSRAYLIRDVRIADGNGKVIESGYVMLRNGKIEQIFAGKPPDHRELNADLIEGSGKTLLPGLIDAQVRLASPGGYRDNPASLNADRSLRELAAYLYCGVMAVRSVGDPPDALVRAQRRVDSGEYLGAQVLTGATAASPSMMPSLALLEAAWQAHDKKTEFLDRSLVQQAGPAALLDSTRRILKNMPPSAAPPVTLQAAMEQLARAWKDGTTLVVGSNSGAPPLLHGPALHREMQLWVQAGIPAPVALQAATGDAAKWLGVGGRLGLIRPGYAASLLLVDGNPLVDISATERISMVFLRGERVDRAKLFDQD